MKNLVMTPGTKFLILTAFSLSLVGLIALVFLAPWVSSLLMLSLLLFWCVRYARERGVVRAIGVFIKEFLTSGL